MLVNTAYQGPRKEGEAVSVPEDFASRWVKNKIAEYVVGQDSNENNNDGPENTNTESPVEEPTNENDYESMSAKELFALCKEKGIEVEPKKSKEYYIEKLS